MVELLAALAFLFVAGCVVALLLAGTGRAPTQRGPREWPLIGALPWVVRHRSDLLGEALSKFRAYGMHVTWSAQWLTARRHHFTANPAIVEHILKVSLPAARTAGGRSTADRMPHLPVAANRARQPVVQGKFDTYVKGEIFATNLGDLLGAGIFTSDGHQVGATDTAAPGGAGACRHARRADMAARLCHSCSGIRNGSSSRTCSR